MTRPPDCPSKCGNVSIPYPFGIGVGCFQGAFSVTCNKTQAYLASTGLRLLEINLTLGEVRVQNPFISMYCNNTDDPGDSIGYGALKSILSLDPFHKVSITKNKLTYIGCSELAMMVGAGTDNEYLTVSSCFSYCTNATNFNNKDDKECRGKGCCQTSFAGNISSFYTETTPILIYSSGVQSSFGPCSYSFVVEEEWFKFDRSYVNSSTNSTSLYPDGVPLVLDWVVGSEICSEAINKGPRYLCQAKNSSCVDVSNGPGYRCNCSSGYEGNPYLQDGCRDINECDPQNKPLYPCKGECTNTDGNYTCTCPSGYRSDDAKIYDCVKADTSTPPKKIADTSTARNMAIGISASIVFLMVCIFALHAEYQKRKLAKEKDRFFDQNGGQILYHQIMSKQVDTLKIYTQEDLKKATNDFDESTELGRGGHGTVYKGILKDNRVVAVKRSKLMNATETNEFVQEIIILSQTNHRNVVRLLGCCLEVEVPILVYEFISNGTLFEFIHGRGNNYESPSPSLDTRLRIAQESAEALSYLHLSTNHPIVHGDVKSMNILLDENYMAKVTDFGASRALPKDEIQFMTLVQGTLGYLDPEYLQERQLTDKSDVYSFGVVLLELITGKTAIYQDGAKQGKSLVSSFMLAMKEGNLQGILDASIVHVGMETLLREVAELARLCLAASSEDRPSMTQVADKLKALRSTWRKKLVVGHSVVRFASAASAPPSSSTFSRETHMTGIGIQTPR
ncbi:wall-associated receptor kinase 5-like [Lolium perenne]|uniref:wall-associated receptor kinase 5-like n=1 Tax=Lolium perenne TaxID=4522 RepID=UPI0021F5AF4B|nr:wall-associated receptor kinase 5-like [Lolium perenne]